MWHSMRFTCGVFQCVVSSREGKSVLRPFPVDDRPLGTLRRACIHFLEWVLLRACGQGGLQRHAERSLLRVGVNVYCLLPAELRFFCPALSIHSFVSALVRECSDSAMTWRWIPVSFTTSASLLFLRCGVFRWRRSVIRAMGCDASRVVWRCEATRKQRIQGGHAMERRETVAAQTTDSCCSSFRCQSCNTDTVHTCSQLSSMYTERNYF